MQASTPADLARASNGTRWTNRELLFHVLFGYLITHNLRFVVKTITKLPAGAQRSFAAALDAATGPFDRINYWGSRAGGRLLSPARMTAWLNRVINSLHRHLDRESAAALRASMAFPTRWDPHFAERMSLADVYHYPTLHFDHHRRQLTLDQRTESAATDPPPDTLVLTPTQAAQVYDRIGRAQDSQAFYEERAVADLIAHADLAHAHSVLDFGCGTGRLAARILPELPADARYLDLDVSTRMVSLATKRLQPWTPRTRVQQIDGSLPLPLPDAMVDRVISTYVFDLLDKKYAQAVLDEFSRVLAPGGLLGLVSLAEGQTPTERAVSTTWAITRTVALCALSARGAL